ncbi:hypothetical protein B1C81_27075 [Streptomyces sp. HG99]|nr:hypothetical protein B1C81_27075 [Streptomyces sp. HG99]
MASLLVFAAWFYARLSVYRSRVTSGFWTLWREVSVEAVDQLIRVPGQAFSAPCSIEGELATAPGCRPGGTAAGDRRQQ